ncbi:uncharacterized protein EURHEDRAFT_173159 [Aspergillus ruber CBS 135680]|uniref:Uncharacterized protein n=1 Tax=Aspergillus ruber (strain CBS 135680) TaxID=1388766 RepID=A0A017S7Q3_ASPRC|nr:uncharacterized protein EURHEDRAFT_173159 [Aspergillus ruber CBS 135680]EYE92987.1 hypothetical protein EURHEDRAFT_173159 [Aspergillus ruber CBS 135680]
MNHNATKLTWPLPLWEAQTTEPSCHSYLDIYTLWWAITLLWLGINRKKASPDMRGSLILFSCCLPSTDRCTSVGRNPTPSSNS